MPEPTALNEIDIDRPVLAGRPIAVTGVTIVGGREVWFNQDYNAKLRGALGIAAYEEVRRDPVVAAGLANILNPIKSAQWSVAPGKSVKGKGGQMEPSAKDLEIAESAKADFIHRSYGGDRVQPIKTFGDVIGHALMSYIFGHSAFNVWWELSPEGRHVAEFLPILPQTVIKFTLNKETRALESLTQRAYGFDGAFEEFTVQASDLELFVWRQEGDNYWGWAALREVYKPWDLKRVLELVDATGLERHACGVDEMHATEELSPEEEAKLQALIQNIRAHHRGGMLTPHNAEYELHSTTGETGVNPSIARVSEEILLALFSGGLLMGGTQATGNRSLGEVKQEDVHIVLQGIVNQVRARLSAGSLRKWTIANYGPQVAYPEFECEPLDKMSGSVLFEILKLAKEAGILTPGAKTEKWARGIIRAPEEDEPYHDPKAPLLSELSDPSGLGDPDGPERGEPGEGGARKPNGEKGVKMSKRLSAGEASVYPSDPSGFRRDAFPHERLVAFTEIKRWMDEEPLRIWHRTVKPIRDEQIKALATRVSEMTEAELATGALQPLMLKPLGAALGKAMLESYRRGRRSVLEEAVRSKRGVVSDENVFRFAADYGDDEDDLFDEYPPEPTKKQATWMMRIGQALALGMTLKMVEEAVRAGQTAQDQGLSKEDTVALVRTALGPPPLGRLSELVAQADIGGKVVQAFTTGRVEQAQAMAEEVTAVFYSARLDNNTCDPCWAMDGEQLDLETYGSMVPNPNCEGGDRCRCEPVFVFRPVTRQEAA